MSRKPLEAIPHFLTPDQWRVELAQVADVSFIIDSWCADESVNVSRLSGEDPEVFKVGQRRRVLDLLSRCRCAVVRPTAAYFTATGLQPDARKLLGWVCYSVDRASMRPIVHFVYVKAEVRKQGLADALLRAAGVRPEQAAWCTHNRLRLKKAMESRAIVYNRFLLDYDPAAKPPRQDPYRP